MQHGYYCIVLLYCKQNVIWPEQEVKAMRITEVGVDTFSLTLKIWNHFYFISFTRFHFYFLNKYAMKLANSS